MEAYPLKFGAIFKEKIWGGQHLATVLGKALPPGARIGESWEISDHGEDASVVRDGPWAGASLHELVSAHAADLLGTHVWSAQEPRFPLLLKFLDAQDWLSVQVHPEDAYPAVREKGELGKTEAWYVVWAAPGAKLICGLSHGVSPDVLRGAVGAKRLGAYLLQVAVRAGDVIFVPAGRVHTLGPGIVTYEVQRNSDVTYRLYDWGRVDDTGKPRDLHLDDALNVMDYTPTVQPKIPPVVLEGSEVRRSFLVACRYFLSELLEIWECYPGCCDGHSFHVLCVLSGSGVLSSGGTQTELHPGESLLLPAGLGRYRISATNVLKVIRSSVPDLVRDVIEPLRGQGRTDAEIAALGGEGRGNDLIPLMTH